jgi:hypothetical protein
MNINYKEVFTKATIYTIFVVLVLMLLAQLNKNYQLKNQIEIHKAIDALKNNIGVEVIYDKDAIKPVVKSSQKPQNKTMSVVNAKCEPSVNPEVNRLLNKYFKDCETVRLAWSISQAESNGKAIRTGYNCYYKNGVVHTERVSGAKSGACKSGHEQYSWSKDLGYLQLNDFFHSACGDLQDLETNIKCASKVYKQAGNSFTPWVTYNQKLHLSYL